MHDDVSSRLRERTSSLRLRLSAWDEYSSLRDAAFRWLAEVERDRAEVDLGDLDPHRLPGVLDRIGVSSHLVYGKCKIFSNLVATLGGRGRSGTSYFPFRLT